MTTVAKDLALINLKFAMWPSALYPPLCAGGGWCINVPRGCATCVSYDGVRGAAS